jgi:hypothetical protein
MMSLPGQLNNLFSSTDCLRKYPNVTDVPHPRPPSIKHRRIKAARLHQIKIPVIFASNVTCCKIVQS